MSTFRVFVAHRKGLDEATLAKLKAEIEAATSVAAAAKAQATGSAVRPVEVVMAIEDLQRNSQRCGGWNGWIRDVVHRTDPMTRERVFACIIVPVEIPGLQTAIGRATNEMIVEALREGVPLRRFSAGVFTPITTAPRQIAPNNWKASWAI
jgi:hypothetical protein